MSKIQKITIEYDDKIMRLEGEEAEKWEESVIAWTYGSGFPALVWIVEPLLDEKRDLIAAAERELCGGSALFADNLP